MTTTTNFEKNGKSYLYISVIAEVKETEKAICLKVNATWNMNKYYEKDLWFPKSVIARDGDAYGVADWFYAKTSEQNAFHGYPMSFRETYFRA